MPNIEVDFDRYCPSLATVFQYNLILLEQGFIQEITLVKNTQTNTYQFTIQRNLSKKI